MKKRIVLVLTILINSVSASALITGKIIPSRITQALQYLLIDLPKNYNTPPFIIYAKLLMWVLVFALLNYGARKAIVRKDGGAVEKRTAKIVALILSLMSVLLMPEAVIAYIFKNYSLVISILLLLFPAFLGVILNLNENVFNKPGRAYAMLRSFLYILIGILAIVAANVIHSYPI
ncbi:hypothetical protein JW930_07460 [Candidatus Woesearchaeota archaeon]|nr:hypothetical protein [Candidatus Woesearchaeota archaeon]